MANETQKEFLERLAKGIATLFGENCEVTVHDLTSGYENTIVAIENGHVTGRRIGDGASELVLKAINEDPENVQDQYSYLARTKAGRMVKSSSVYVRDEDGKLVGAVTHVLVNDPAKGYGLSIQDMIAAARE